MARVGYLIFQAAAWVTIALAVILPTAITLGHCVRDGVPPADGWGVSGRQIGLLARTILLALPAALVAIVVAVPVAASLFRGAKDRGGRWLLALAVCPLLISPTVMTFGWARALGDPAWMQRYAEVACIWSWAAWLWPIPALMLGAAWSSAGRSAYEAALLETHRTRAFVVGALPALRRPLLASILILLVLFSADYNVPHACSLQVYATELLGWAANYTEPIHTLWASLPLLVAMGLIAATTVRAIGMGRAAARSPLDVRGASPFSSLRPVGWIVGTVMVAVPIAGLAGRLETADSFGAMARTYPDAIVFSVLLAGAGGLFAVWSGFAVVQGGAFGRATAIVLLAVGILPGALMGKALAVTYVGLPAFYDHWPIVVLAYAGRYGWIGVAVGWFMRHASADEMEAMARVDGAGSAEVFFWLRLGTGWPALLAAWLVATGMSLTDLATAPQVAPPQFPLLSVILVEKFHRFEEQMLVSISLTMLALPIVAAMLMGLFARRVDRAQ